ncbi:MAG: sensor histidine kinase [Bacteriovorax sp.]
MVLMNALLAVLYCFLLWLNKNKYYDIPKYFIVFFVSTPVFMAAGMLGKASNLHFSLIPVAGFSVLLFDPKEKIKIVLTIAYPMLLLAILIGFHFNLFPNLIGKQLEIVPAFEYLINIFIVLSTMFYLYFANIKIEENYKALCEEHMKAQKELDEERAKAIHSTKMAALGEMAGGIAHEINGPLQIINILSKKINSCAVTSNLDNENVLSMSKQIQETCLKMAGIVKTLSSLSRSSHNDPMQIVDIHSLIQETLIICNHRFHLSTITLEVNCEEKLPKVLCRPGDIGQILINLLNNAYDAVFKISNPKVVLAAKHFENKVMLTVEDNGPGVATAIQEKIFETFFTTKQIGKGTGLGLSISKKLIEANNGRLYLESMPGSTRFIVELQQA